jgi:nicotinate-nucleotide pyrophosphorylase (carboxylating)
MEFNKQFYHLIDEALTEDVGEGDHSTLSCIPENARGKAVLKIKQEGILAGVEVAEKIFHYKDPAAIFTALKRDGEMVKAGEMAFEVEASVHTILQCERLVLNCMQRMSGIATLTRQFADRLYGHKTKLLDIKNKHDSKLSSVGKGSSENRRGRKSSFWFIRYDHAEG